MPFLPEGGGRPEAVPLDQPGRVVSLAEGEQRPAQLLDRGEALHPQEVFLQGADEALGAAVPFGGPDEGRRALDAQEAQLLLEIAGHVLAAVVVADRETAGDVLREAAEVAPHPLAERLEGLEAVRLEGSVGADALGRAVVDGDEKGRAARRGGRGRAGRARPSAAAPGAGRCGCRRGAISPTPCGGPRRGTGWRPAPPGSPPGARHPASARPAPAAAGRPRAAARDGGRRSSGRRPRRGRPGRARTARRPMVRSSGSSPRPPSGPRAAAFSASSSRSSTVSPSLAFSRSTSRSLASAGLVASAASPPARKASRQPASVAAVTPSARETVSRSSPRRSRSTASRLRGRDIRPPRPGPTPLASVVAVVMVHLRCGRGPLTRCPVQP